MKSINLIGLAAALLLVAGVAQAGDDKANTIVDQNLSKRPYQDQQKSSNDSSAKKTDNWDGATLVKEDTGEAKAVPNKYQQLRIRMLGQRPYMEKSPD